MTKLKKIWFYLVIVKIKLVRNVKIENTQCDLFSK
jgi:hypothetical protein